MKKCAIKLPDLNKAKHKQSPGHRHGQEAKPKKHTVKSKKESTVKNTKKDAKMVWKPFGM